MEGTTSLTVLVPSAMSQDVVEVEGHPLLRDQHVNLGLLLRRQQLEQSLGGEPIRCSLLVGAGRQIEEQVVCDVEDVVDDAHPKIKPLRLR